VPELDAFIGQVMAAITRQLGAFSSNLRVPNADQKGMRIELFFHDGSVIQLEMAKEVLTGKENDLFNFVERANDLARFGLAEARRSVLALKPMIIKDAGLIESLKMLAKRSNIPGRLRCTFGSNLEEDESVPVVVRQDLMRIAQEAISDALRHAKSTGSAALHPGLNSLTASR
jgi:signal transduction histidine kinase